VPKKKPKNTCKLYWMSQSIQLSFSISRHFIFLKQKPKAYTFYHMCSSELCWQCLAYQWFDSIQQKSLLVNLADCHNTNSDWCNSLHCPSCSNDPPAKSDISRYPDNHLEQRIQQPLPLDIQERKQQTLK